MLLYGFPSLECNDSPPCDYSISIYERNALVPFLLYNGLTYLSASILPHYMAYTMNR